MEDWNILWSAVVLTRLDIGVFYDRRVPADSRRCWPTELFPSTEAGICHRDIDAKNASLSTFPDISVLSL